MTENPTTLGLAVHGYLARPVLGADVSATIPRQNRDETLLAELDHLYSIELLDDKQRQYIVDAVTTGSIRKPERDVYGECPIGMVLITTARRYVKDMSAAHDVTAALSAVAAAAISGFAHSGPEAAFAIAAVASVRAISDGYKQ
jgi:hypothetical protein